MQEVQSTKERLSQFERVSVIGAMSSLLAHEINGPVSAISNSCNALDRYLQDDEQHSPLIDKTVQRRGVLPASRCQPRWRRLSRVAGLCKERKEESAFESPGGFASAFSCAAFCFRRIFPQGVT